MAQLKVGNVSILVLWGICEKLYLMIEESEKGIAKGVPYDLFWIFEYFTPEPFGGLLSANF